MENGASVDIKQQKAHKDNARSVWHLAHTSKNYRSVIQNLQSWLKQSANDSFIQVSLSSPVCTSWAFYFFSQILSRALLMIARLDNDWCPSKRNGRSSGCICRSGWYVCWCVRFFTTIARRISAAPLLLLLLLLLLCVCVCLCVCVGGGGGGGCYEKTPQHNKKPLLIPREISWPHTPLTYTPP